MTSELIIDQPQQISTPRRVLYGTITAIIWYFWLYLWLPVATFAGWAFGGFVGYHEMIELQGYRGLLHLMLWYGLVIAIMAGGLLIWATYNLLRFRGKERRGQLPDVQCDIYAKYIGVTEVELASWRRAKIVTTSHDINGHFGKVVVTCPIC